MLKALNNIFQGNCIEVLQILLDKSIDLIFAYPRQTNGSLFRDNCKIFSDVYNQWDKFHLLKHYYEFCTAWLIKCKRVFKDSSGKKVYSAQKPESLLKKILYNPKEGDLVLDQSFNTDTTGDVVKMLGRNYIGIEQYKNYCKTTKQRINKVIYKSDTFTTGKLKSKPTKVSLKMFLDSGILTINEQFYDKNKKYICKLIKNQKEYKIYDDSKVLSIYQMATKHLNRQNYNAWKYFYIIKGDNLHTLDSLRYIYKESRDR